VRVLCSGNEKSGKAERQRRAQNQNINLAERWDQLQSDFLMYSPSGGIAAPTHRMSWQEEKGSTARMRMRMRMRMRTRRWPPGGEATKWGTTTNRQICKRGARHKGGPYRIYLCICSDLAPKSQSEKKDQRIKQKTQSTNSFRWPTRIPGCRAPKSGTKQEGLGGWSRGLRIGDRESQIGWTMTMAMHHQCRGTLISNLHLKLMHARQDQPAEMPMQWLPQLHWENILKSEPTRKVKKKNL